MSESNKKKKKKHNLFDLKDSMPPPYKTIKIPLKSLLNNYDSIYPIVNSLVLKFNDLIIHSYQFIRLFILHSYHNRLPFPPFTLEFVKYSIKTLGTRDNRGGKPQNIDLHNTLNNFYNFEYKNLVNHIPTDLIFCSQIVEYLSTQLFK